MRQMRLDPYHQNAGRKGLFNVIIRTEAKAADLIHILATGGHHKDGNILFGAHLFADGKAIDTGQHHIQQDQVKRLMQGGIQSCGSIRGNGHGVSAQLQIVPFDGRNVGIIFHNKNSFQLHITLPLPLAAASRYAVLHREHSPPGHFRPFAA